MPIEARAVHDKPLAVSGLTSYRYKGKYGWIMIGAKDNDGALREARRSIDYSNEATLDRLEVWSEQACEYVQCKKSDTVTLPAYWASLLINGDDSGFSDPAELRRACAAKHDLMREGWRVVDAGEPRFTNNYGLYDPGVEGVQSGEVIEYTILREVR